MAQKYSVIRVLFVPVFWGLWGFEVYDMSNPHKPIRYHAGRWLHLGKRGMRAKRIELVYMLMIEGSKDGSPINKTEVVLFEDNGNVVDYKIKWAGVW